MLPSRSRILFKALCMWTTQLQSSPKKNAHTIPTVLHLPPTASKHGQAYTSQFVTYWFSQYQPSSVRAKSPQARVTDHRKQYFSFLALTLYYRVIQWPPTHSPIFKRFWLFFSFWSADQGRAFLKQPRTSPPNRRKLIHLSFITWLSSTNQSLIIIWACNRWNHEAFQLTDIFPFTS